MSQWSHSSWHIKLNCQLTLTLFHFLVFSSIYVPVKVVVTDIKVSYQLSLVLFICYTFHFCHFPLNSIPYSHRSCYSWHQSTVLNNFPFLNNPLLYFYTNSNSYLNISHYFWHIILYYQLFLILSHLYTIPYIIHILMEIVVPDWVLFYYTFIRSIFIILWTLNSYSYGSCCSCHISFYYELSFI